ncbi:MAG: VanZ family protein [Flaviaesturariibacter sp.]|nr:VanZ family protein [Flaviaesturariibacter sp.]
MSFLKSKRLLLPLLYTFFLSVLFFLPGAAFPKASWLDLIYFDKLVHVGLFALLAFLWCWALLLTHAQLIKLFLLLAAYGLGVEIIQETWVLHRSFDWVDWLADTIGASFGILVHRRVYIKK